MLMEDASRRTRNLWKDEPELVDIDEVFEALLHSFDIRVLTAYKPNFSQFLMFYACSLDRGAFGSRFESMLLDTFKSLDKPRDQRKCVVRYLGSYVSRARFVSTSEAIIILKSLVDWL